MSNEELELRLLKNAELDFYGHKFKCLTLEEIIEIIGFDTYASLTSVLSIDKNWILNVSLNMDEQIPDEIVEKITTFDIFVSHLNLMDKLIKLLRIFLRYENIYYIPEYQIIVIDKGNIDKFITINGQNLDELFQLLRYAYCLKFEKPEEEIKPANEKARQMLARIKKEDIEHPKPKKSSIDLMSVISGVAHKSNSLNIINIWQLSLYQLWDSYYRLVIIDDNNNTITGIYAGTVDKEKIDLKEISWIKKIKK